MRQLSHLTDERQATTFSDYLYTQDIENNVEAEGGGWSIWVRDEDRFQQAQSLLAEFQRSPADARYAKAARAAREKRERAQEEAESLGKRVFDRDTLFPEESGLGRATMVLIGVSLLVTFVTRFGEGPVFRQWLAFARDYNIVNAFVTWELWRWVTPIFVHMSFTHALFNMIMLGDLGNRVERRLGPARFLALVLLLAIPPNAAQFVLHGPAFGGMSGVLYGLFGYCWMRGRIDPQCGLELHPTSVAIMMAWYFLCLFGIIGNVANTVHTVGLALGMIAGLAAGLLRR